MKALECLQHFSHYKSMEVFPDAQGQLTPQPECLIWQYFELIRDFMVALVICREYDPIKNKDARDVTSLIINFSDAQGS